MIRALRGVSFNWMDAVDGLGRQIGFIALEVERVVPELLTTGANSFKAVAYANITALLVEALEAEASERERLARALGEEVQRLPGRRGRKEQAAREFVVQTPARREYSGSSRAEGGSGYEVPGAGARSWRVLAGGSDAP